MVKYLFLDFETTGLDYKTNPPIEVAFNLTDKFGESEYVYSSLIKLPERVKVSEFITSLTGITDEMVRNTGKEISEVKKVLKEVVDDCVVVAHHASFDLAYLKYYFDIEPKKFLCTRHMWNNFLKEGERAGLQDIYNNYIGEQTQEHRALGDVKMLTSIFFKLLDTQDITLDVYYNKLSEVAGRPLAYIPSNAKVV